VSRFRYLSYISFVKQKQDNIKVSKQAFREWLEKLQQESWQLELIISGFALFAIWEARVLIDDFETYQFLHRRASGTVDMIAGASRMLLQTGWRIFFFNLLLHVIIRGLWIGAIGLRYVSSDIDYDSLNYADNFTRFLRKKVGSFDDYIEKLERFASILFAYTFLLFFLFFSLVFYFFLFALFTVFFRDENLVGLFGLVYILFAIIPFIDFITMGGIKRIKEKNISRVYFVIYRVFSILTLSFLYRPLLYNFWDEKYTRRLFLLSIPYIFLLTLGPNIESAATPYFPIYNGSEIFRTTAEKDIFDTQYYDDERAAKTREGGIFESKIPIRTISLPSIELSGNYTWLFLRSYPSDNKWIEQQITPYKKSGVTIDGFDNRVDTLYENIEAERSSQLADLIRKRRAVNKAIKAGATDTVSVGIIDKAGTIQIDSTYWEAQRDSVEAYWEKELTAYQVDKVKRLKNSLLSVATIRMDSIDYTDSCECRFYIHPNIGERGLRCYFPLQSLDMGLHILHLERQFYDDDNDVFNTTDYYIPFYKVAYKNR
jgi:hypothetical protein